MLLVPPAALAQAEAWVDDCGLEPPGSVPRPPVPTKAFEGWVLPGDPAVVRRERQTPRIGFPGARLGNPGPLAGKTVYLSAGHGFTWTQALTPPSWRTQRGNTNAIVEDLVSTETLSQWLLPMLMNAGAQVVTVRESDVQTNLVIVDDGAPGYAESGAGFSDSTLPGWGTPPSPMLGNTLPFGLGKNRIVDAAATQTASASYTAALPADGWYNVYVSYTAFAGRVTDAHYVVKHRGGESHFRVNQRRHGGTWVLLGNFYFTRTQPAQVVVLNDSAVAGNLSLDAVRFGGGMGLTNRGGGVSGRPRFEESARYGTQYAGAPVAVFGPNGDDRTDDVGARSRFAAWVHEPGEDAIYVAWHTNAFNGSAVGTDVYVYGPNPPDGNYQFTGVAGSDRLAQFVHQELINDIKSPSGWNQPAWYDRGIHSAYFGELNPTNNNEMPAILMEIAFHDAPSDAAHLKEPGFRYLAARAITQGIVRFFAEKDGVTPRFFPEPPTHLAAQAQPNGQVAVRWHAAPTDANGVRGSAATKYRVYSSPDGLAWDDGFEVLAAGYTTALAAGEARLFRVTAVNDGGESFPSEVVGARAPQPGGPQVLVVNAFDRLDASMAPTEGLAAYALGNVLRIFPGRMNDGTYAARHGEGWAFAQVGFDSATAQAVLAGDVQLAPYAAVDWMAGRGHAAGAAPTAAEQTALDGYVAGGGALVFSGTVWASGLNMSPAGQGFLANTLRAAFGAATGSAPITAQTGTFLDGLPGLSLDDGKQSSYLTGPSDVISPASGSATVASYAGGTSAGVLWNKKVLALGFPIETVVGKNARLELIARAAVELGLTTVVPPLPDGGEPDPDGGTVTPEPIVLDSLGEQMLPVYGQVTGGCGCASGAGLFPAALLLLLLRRRQRGR
jgi:N-acetylmuramoyl-L-alanine amidase